MGDLDFSLELKWPHSFTGEAAGEVRTCHLTVSEGALRMYYKYH